MQGNALAIANNDIVYLWWSRAAKITHCLGFSVRRLQAGKPDRTLPAFVAFKGMQIAKTNGNTDFWPIQSYQWKDLFVPEETNVSYEIVPMTGTPGKKLTPIPGVKLKTKLIKATDTFGKHHVVFNRGIISTQSLSKQLPKDKHGKPSAGALTKHIKTSGDKIRSALAGEALTLLPGLLARGKKEGGTCYCALYELTDVDLIAALVAAKGHVELILTNADSAKIVVIDPFTPNCVVVTGSHNLGFKASYSNDENLCIIRGNAKIAQAYAAHVLDITNHYAFRAALTDANKQGKKPDTVFSSLKLNDTWQDFYFASEFLTSRDRFFFP